MCLINDVIGQLLNHYTFALHGATEELLALKVFLCYPDDEGSKHL
jgi:hypothetical protein